MNDQHPNGALDRPMFWEPSVAFLKWAIVLILGSSAAFLIVLFIVAPEQMRTVRAAGPVVLSLVATAALVLQSRGKIKASVHVLVAGLWAYTTGIALLLGGLNSMFIIVYPLIIIVAGWLLGPRMATAVAMLTAAACFGFFLAELHGFLPVRPPTSPALMWIVQTAVFVFAALLITYLVRSYRNRLEEVRKLGIDLDLRTAEVRAREADLTRAQAVAHVGSWVYDLAADVMRLSAETCRIFGLPEGTTGSHDTYLSRVHPDDRVRVDSAWQAALKGGEPFDNEHRILVGKTVRWVRQRAELEFGADGAPLRGVGTTQDITEFKRHEAELVAARNQLNATLDAVPDLLFDVGLDGRYYDYHSPRADLLAAPPADFIGKKVSDFLPPAAADVGMSALREAHEKGRSHGKQFELALPQGKLWFELSVSRKLVDPGEEPRFIVLSRDITERKLAEEARRQSEARYHSLFANSSVAMLLIDPVEGGIVEANAAACAYYGWDLKALQAMRITDISTFSPDEVRAEMSRTREMKQRHFDFRHRLANGEVRDVEVFSGPVEIDGRKLLLSIVQDVTERKKAQGELRKSIAFRELLLEAMPLPVFYKDTSGRYAGGNSAFARFIGKSMQDIVGKTVFEVSPRSFAQTYRDKDLDLLNDPLGVQTYESQVAHADGTAHDVIFHKARMVDEAGRPTGILGTITDITEIKRIEAARDRLEAQLRESQKMEALGTLAGGVAHDFNNILAAIMGNAELARQDVGPAHAALESLEEIRKASRRAKDLVQQILAFGRRQVLAREVISLAPVVVESARLLRTTLPAGVSLSVECAANTPAVLADATQIEQVLLNLCGNAWQAIQGQGRPGVIEVRLEARDHVAEGARDSRVAGMYGDLRPGRYACLTVRDNGSGMDSETMAHIFEPFYTTKPAGKGTGLGLAVVHGIVQEHKARIEVQSGPGEGTTFRIYFPVAQVQAPGAPAQASDSASAHGQGRHILFVDDDEAIVFLMTRLLERQGYRVSGYTDTQKALAAVRAEPEAFDLAVTDYNMPGMSGLEVARALRQIRADLPIALASGYITEDLRAQAPAAGASELIYKPNTVDELCDTIARLANADYAKENFS